MIAEVKRLGLPALLIATMLALTLPLPSEAWAPKDTLVADAPKGCTFTARADVDLQLFDDDLNADEGDFIDSFKLKRGETSIAIQPENSRGYLWYKFRYPGSRTWVTKFRVVCTPGRNFDVP